jgi:DNA-directed RNA polymerase subunit RPC12/RpoP
MKRRITSKERERGGAMKQNERGDAIRSSPASEQLWTRSCARCGGLLVSEWYYDLHNTGEHNVKTLRCVQCGHRIDPVILQNQVQTSFESQSLRQVRRQYSTRTDLLRDVA